MKSSNVLASQDYCIDPNNVGFILAILRDKLYTNKSLAVVREYICNAIDAHIEANKLDTPIKISAPTILYPFFRVKDRGLGLSPDNMDNVFRKFGNTTKQGDINTIGENGIGAKCAFAITDTFTIVSYYEGTKYTYCSYIDGTANKLDLLESVPTEEENGVEVIVPISDIELFIKELKGFLNYFESSIPLDINITLPIKCCCISTEEYALYDGYPGKVFILIKGCPYIYNYPQYKGDFIIKGDNYPDLFTIGPGREYINTTTEANQLINALHKIVESNCIFEKNTVYNSLDIGIKVAELFSLSSFHYGTDRKFFNMSTYRNLATKKLYIYNDTTALYANINSYIKSRGLQDTHQALNKELKILLNKHPDLKSIFTSFPLSEIKLLPIINKRLKSNAKTIKGPKTIKVQKAVPYLSSRISIPIEQSSTTVYITAYLDQLRNYKHMLSLYNLPQVIVDYLQAPVYITNALKSVEKESNWISDEKYLGTLIDLLNKEAPDLYKALVSFIYLTQLTPYYSSLIGRLKYLFPDSSLIKQISTWKYDYINVEFNKINPIPDYIYEDIQMQFPLIILDYRYRSTFDDLDDIKDFLFNKQ